MKRTVVVTGGGSTTTIPLTIVLTRMPLEEYQTQEKERAERLAALQKTTAERKAKEAEAAKEAAGKRLDPAKKKQILADLNSSHWPTIQNRLRSLKRFVPHPDDFDIAMRVKELQTHNVAGVFMSAKSLWKNLDPIVEAGRKDMPTTKTAGDNPFATADEKQANEARGLRQWTSGEYKVEAEFVKLDGDRIVLKRKDGKQIPVPISALSKADQEIVAILKQETTKPAKSANPFE